MQREPSESLAAQVLQNSRALFVAGCCFDELPPAVIMEGVHSHRAAGGAVFFDPGPRSMTFRDSQRRTALDTLLDSTDVVLMTQVSSRERHGSGQMCRLSGVWQASLRSMMPQEGPSNFHL